MKPIIFPNIRLAKRTRRRNSKDFDEAMRLWICPGESEPSEAAHTISLVLSNSGYNVCKQVLFVTVSSKTIIRACNAIQHRRLLSLNFFKTFMNRINCMLCRV